MKASYTRRRITATIDSPVVRVRGWQAHKLALEAGIKSVYVIDSWVFDEKRLPDLLAHCERRNVFVEVEGQEPCTAVHIQTEEELSNALDSLDADVPLFGGDVA